ncbi:YozE family protein [Vagococcus sp. BWB3-3]|uniref:UPF0346 protein I6N95_06185 n=1 Tax=Vagococcus allomyrinae TaxID=2794353 RepID=A0A940P8V2_9ENTE|nr:YozE family protein [Vagococcus allomyrinae]
MRRSFYHYVLTLRGPKINEPETKLANAIGIDIQFPKQSESHSEISDYLELSTSYLDNMDIFDELWQKYLDHN